MENGLSTVGVILLGLLLVAVAAVIGGTIVFWLWPHVVPAVIPGLVASGAVAGTLTWGKAVLLTWVCGILFSSSSANTKK